MNCAICTTRIEVNYKELNEKCFCGDTTTKSQFSSFSSHSPVFISHKVEASIKEAISVVEKVIQSDIFKKSLITNLNLKNSSGGILSCYDFHLDGDLPKLIVPLHLALAQDRAAGACSADQTGQPPRVP